MNLSPQYAIVPAILRHTGLRPGIHLIAASETSRKLCSMGRGCSWQPYCISTIHGSHTGSWAGMTIRFAARMHGSNTLKTRYSFPLQ
ncbi:MAG: hypothetical protein ACERLB_07140 [Gammaproteobacteria bacterium]